MAGLIYTANLGGYDRPRRLKVEPELGVRYWMFGNGIQARGWDPLHPPWPVTKSPLKLARELKVLMPILHPLMDWFLWMDGTMQLKAPVLPWIEKLLESGVNFAAFRHNEFGCSYLEIDACIARCKDSKSNLEAARTMLRKSRFPDDYGQVATGFLWRRSCPEVREHARTWWEAMKATTMRDQATFMWALKACGQEVEYLPGLHTKNNLVHYHRGHEK
jgi:hypothetical protein